jgi:integrase
MEEGNRKAVPVYRSDNFKIRVEPRGDRPGLWRIIYTTGRGKARKRSSSEDFRSLEQAVGAAEDIVRDYLDGVFTLPQAPPVTLAELVDRFVETKPHRGRTTQRSYRTHLKPAVLGLGERRVFRSIQTNEIQRWLDSLTCKNPTKAGYRRSLRACLRWAVKNGWMTTDPAKDVTVHVEPDIGPRLSIDQIEVFLGACSQDFRPIAEIAIFAGLRRAEVAAMRWDWVDFRGGSIVVRAHQDIGFAPKSHQIRSIPMNHRSRAVLNAMDERRKSPWVFPQRDGDRRSLTTTWFNIATKKACVNAGIVVVRSSDGKLLDFHGLRRTFGAFALERGVSIFTVSKWLGHQSVTTTERSYVDLADSHSREQMRMMDPPLPGGNKDIRIVPNSDTQADTQADFGVQKVVEKKPNSLK